MKVIPATLTFLTVAVGVCFFMQPRKSPPLDLRDAVADKNSADFDTTLPTFEKYNAINVPQPKAVAVERSPKGHAFKPEVPIDWVAINSGRFMMGTDESTPSQLLENARPSHEVSIKAFHITKTAVTVEQYAECVIKGKCTEPTTDAHGGLEAYCNWRKPDRRFHPVNCVSWNQAKQYAKFKGARLPSEAEWEYAATSEGRNQKYPWGNETASCYRAVMRCANNSRPSGTMPVCSKPAGNTAQGLCDMSGNVYQWVQDGYQDTYKGAHTDGRAFEAAGALRVVRGGSFADTEEDLALRAQYRTRFPPDYFGQNNIGFRLARSSSR